MISQAPSPSAFRVAELSQNSPNTFEVRPDATQNKAIATELGLLDVRKLRFVGQIKAMADADWVLTASLGVTVVQPCTVTLDPVTTRVETTTERVFFKEIEIYEGEDEVEMPEDERTERLGQWIDVEAVMIETLSLALPEYPRSTNADLGQAVFSDKGVAPMTDEDARPFAGLAALKDKLEPKD
ncbi:MAG: uncharacterized metal-binding protein YceD (DUF177 family) [Ascidiaceihabitans sp.]|jgi:uncharacterized metal-binding protein YceD (DUF177 family)